MADSAKAQPASQPATAPAAPVLPPGFVVRSIETGEPSPRQYVVFVPPRRTASTAWPLLVFLHGSGECGTNSHRQLQVGLGPYIAARRLNDFPFITLFPQVPATSNPVEGFAGRQGAWVWRMIDAVMREYQIDADRVYLTGLSMGGFGTWDLAMQHPDRFAAIAPLCGGSRTRQCIANLSLMPVWAFHGRLDDRVRVDHTRDLVAALRAAGGKPRFLEYPDLRHNCWDRTYENDELYRWLLSHRRIAAPARFSYSLPDDARAALPFSVWWLRLDEVADAPAEVRAECEIDGDHHVRIRGAGLRRVTLLARGMPTDAATRVVVEFNGRTAFEGELKEDVALSAAN